MVLKVSNNGCDVVGDTAGMVAIGVGVVGVCEEVVGENVFDVTVVNIWVRVITVVPGGSVDVVVNVVVLMSVSSGSLDV